MSRSCLPIFTGMANSRINFRYRTNVMAQLFARYFSVGVINTLLNWVVCAVLHRST